MEFTAIGTAVRAPGAGARAAGARYLRCVRAGFRQADHGGLGADGLALGVSIGLRHDDRTTARQARGWSSGNAEVAGWTELVSESRHDARRLLESDVRRLGGEGVVVAAMQLRVRKRDCPVEVGRHDHVVEATLVGTAIARFSRAGRRPARPTLAVMSLDPQRRQVR